MKRIDFVRPAVIGEAGSSSVEDLESLDHIGVIHRGQLVATGPTDTLRNGRRLEEAFIDVIGATTVDDQALAWLG